MKPPRRRVADRPAWPLVAPTALVLAAFVAAPLAATLGLSLVSWDLLAPPRFVGLGNYETLVRSGELARIAGRTLAYATLVVLGTSASGLGLALLLDRPGRGYALVRGAIFSAYVVSWVAVALLFVGLVDPVAGPLGPVVRWLGTGAISPLARPTSALAVLAAVTVWKLAGYTMVVYLAALRTVPPELLEAARLDGAGPVARFRYVVWPWLRPTTTFVVTTSWVLAFQAFDVVRIMTQGGPARGTTTFVYAVYEEVFLDLRVGRASALTVVFFVLLGVVAWANLRALRERA